MYVGQVLGFTAVGIVAAVNYCFQFVETGDE